MSESSDTAPDAHQSASHSGPSASVYDYEGEVGIDSDSVDPTSLPGFDHFNEFGLPVDKNDDSISVYDYSSDASSEHSEGEEEIAPSAEQVFFTTTLQQIDRDIQKWSRDLTGAMTLRANLCEHQQAVLRNYQAVLNNWKDVLDDIKNDINDTSRGSEEHSFREAMLSEAVAARALEVQRHEQEVEENDETLRMFAEAIDGIKRDLRLRRRTRAYMQRAALDKEEREGRG